MTRIVAGFAGSLSLEVPRSGTRPTSDRVREAIFSALAARRSLDGIRVLDLYAGSGALGLEAASRGARAVALVDSSRDAAGVCRVNAEAVSRAAGKRNAPSVEVSVTPVLTFVARARTSDSYDLIFADPPYDLGEEDLAAVLRHLPELLAEHGVLVLERSGKSPEPMLPESLEALRRRDYGDTAVWWIEHTPRDHPPGHEAQPA